MRARPPAAARPERRSPSAPRRSRPGRPPAGLRPPQPLRRHLPGRPRPAEGRARASGRPRRHTPRHTARAHTRAPPPARGWAHAPPTGRFRLIVKRFPPVGDGVRSLGLPRASMGWLGWSNSRRSGIAAATVRHWVARASACAACTPASTPSGMRCCGPKDTGSRRCSLAGRGGALTWIGAPLIGGSGKATAAVIDVTAPIRTGSRAGRVANSLRRAAAAGRDDRRRRSCPARPLLARCLDLAGVLRGRTGRWPSRRASASGCSI